MQQNFVDIHAVDERLFKLPQQNFVDIHAVDERLFKLPQLESGSVICSGPRRRRRPCTLSLAGPPRLNCRFDRRNPIRVTRRIRGREVKPEVKVLVKA